MLGSTPDGRIKIVIRGRDAYALAGELAGLNEWLEVTGPQGVRDHLASIGLALVARCSTRSAKAQTLRALPTHRCPRGLGHFPCG